MTDREAFEVWAKEKGTPFYLGGATQEYSLFAWQAWQAATAAKDAEIAALKAERDALLEALRVIAFMQHDIGSPPIISEAEAMRLKARTAIAKAEGGAA